MLFQITCMSPFPPVPHVIGETGTDICDRVRVNQSLIELNGMASRLTDSVPRSVVE